MVAAEMNPNIEDAVRKCFFLLLLFLIVSLLDSDVVLNRKLWPVHGNETSGDIFSLTALGFSE